MSLILQNIKSNHLRRYRQKRSLRQRDIAYLVGSKTKDINRWERGIRIPNLRNALKLSAALNCPVEVIFFDYFSKMRKEIYQRKQGLKINQI